MVEEQLWSEEVSHSGATQVYRTEEPGEVRGVPALNTGRNGTYKRYQRLHSTLEKLHMTSTN